MRRTSGALEMHLDDSVPFGFAHVGEHAVAQDARVVDENVESAERRDGLIDESFCASPFADVVGIGNGLSAGGNNFIDHFLSWAFVDTSAVSGTAEIVHHDLCAFGGEHQRVVAPDSTTSACNDAHSAFTQSCHDDVSLVSSDLRSRL